MWVQANRILAFNSGTVLAHLYATILYGTHENGESSPSISSQIPTSSVLPCSTKKPASTASSHHVRPNGLYSTTGMKTMSSLYVQCRSPFPQVEEFVDQCRSRYHLDITQINAGMKDALKKYKEQNEKHGKGIDAVLIGTRIGDPYSGTVMAPRSPFKAECQAPNAN